MPKVRPEYFVIFKSRAKSQVNLDTKILWMHVKVMKDGRSVKVKFYLLVWDGRQRGEGTVFGLANTCKNKSTTDHAFVFSTSVSRSKIFNFRAARGVAKTGQTAMAFPQK